MKKLLALVLALVMTLSLCVTSNAAFTDAKDVDADFEEAVAVLNGMGVFKGYEDGSFKPEGNITRAEVAAIVYRLYTGDVKDKQAGLYAGYGKFDDMAAAQWAAGYVGFCANAGFVKGYGNGKFGPSDPVTGYQALAMILRAVGYGQNGEFEGADWELHVASIAQQLKVLKNVKNVSLKTAASRQLVAELLFQVAANVNTVTYTSAFGYVGVTLDNIRGALTDGDNEKVLNTTLGKKNFDLVKVEDKADDWGRPCYKWTNNKNSSHKDYVCYATIAAKPVVTYTETTKQCDIYEDLGLTSDTNKNLVTVWNGKEIDKQTIVDKNTNAAFTAQGRLVEFYDVTKDSDENDVYKIVVIDTYLAKVAKVVEEKLDKNDHVTRDAYLELTAYRTNDTGVTVYVEGNDFAKGDYILVNVNDKVKEDITGLGEKALVEVVGLAESVDAVQTKIYNNNTPSKHTVDGTDYDDACRFYLDDAKKDGTKKYTWFFDQYGNVIGDVAIETEYTYGVLTNIYRDVVAGKGTVYGEIVYMDGTESGVVTIAKVVNANGVDKIKDIAQDSAKTPNKNLVDSHLYRIETNKDGELLLEQGGITWDANATIETKNPNLGAAKADNNTVFLVRGGNEDDGYTYTSVTGIDNVDDFTDVTIDWFDTSDSDTYANYVFVKADPDKATVKKLVYVADNDFSETLKTKGNAEVKFYTYENVYDLAGEQFVLKTETAKAKIDAAKGYVALVTVKGDYVIDLTRVDMNANCPTLLEKSDVEVLCAQTSANVIAANATEILHDDNELYDFYNLNNAVVIKANGTVGDVADLKSEALHDADIKTIYVARDTSDKFAATAVVLSKVQNTFDCAHDDTYTLTVTAANCTATVDGVAYTAPVEGLKTGDKRTVVVTANEGYILKDGSNFVESKTEEVTVANADIAKDYTALVKEQVYTVTVDGVTVGKFAEGETVALTKDAAGAATGTGFQYTVGAVDKYQAYGNYTVKAADATANVIAFTTGYVKWTLNSANPQPVAYNTSEGKTISEVFTGMSGTYVYDGSNYGPKASAKYVPNADHNFTDGFYQVTMSESGHPFGAMKVVYGTTTLVNSLSDGSDNVNAYVTKDSTVTITNVSKTAGNINVTVKVGTASPVSKSLDGVAAWDVKVTGDTTITLSTQN